MEKTVLTRSLKFLDERGLELGILITDRHRQLGKFLREEYPQIVHLFDFWHIGKGFCSKAITQLEAIVCSTSLKHDVRQMLGRFQTSYIEAFHSLLNHFTPKMLAFSYIGMKSRTLLAGMHFTENMGRHHLINKKGENV
ncbi:hypothetical protein ScPMuIL_003980 [Solemya velum]